MRKTPSLRFVQQNRRFCVQLSFAQFVQEMQRKAMPFLHKTLSLCFCISLYLRTKVRSFTLLADSRVLEQKNLLEIFCSRNKKIQKEFFVQETQSVSLNAEHFFEQEIAH